VAGRGGRDERGTFGLFAGDGGDVVPVVARGTQALDQPMAGDDLTTGGLARLLGVEAAADLVAARQQRRQPRASERTPAVEVQRQAVGIGASWHPAWSW
jgi:hypothetical protein